MHEDARARASAPRTTIFQDGIYIGDNTMPPASSNFCINHVLCCRVRASAGGGSSSGSSSRCDIDGGGAATATSQKPTAPVRRQQCRSQCEFHQARWAAITKKEETAARELPESFVRPGHDDTMLRICEKQMRSAIGGRVTGLRKL